MSGGGSGQGALYSPLPQSISDTDSSEEELISVVHHNVNKKLVISGKETIEKRNGQKMGDYRPLDHDTEPDVVINGFPSRQTTADNVPIIKPEGIQPRHMQPMSPLRKICFILSIFLCGLTIVVFLWVIPCDWATCPSAPVKVGKKTWEKTLETIELKGRISAVSGVSGRGHNLVFLIRDDIRSTFLGQGKSLKEGAEMLPPNGGGILSLIGSTGEVAWWRKLHSLPRDIDCSLVDFNSDKVTDCIAVGANKLLVAIDPISGNEIWRLHNGSSELNAVDIDFPLILPDLDEDGKNEMVAACSIVLNDTNKSEPFEHNHLILISGNSGKMIGQSWKIENCSNVSKLGLETGDWNISFTCEHSLPGKGPLRSISQISLQELYAKTTKASIPASINLMKYKHLPLKQHQILSSQEANDINGRRMSITKPSSCHHDHCLFKAKLYDEKSDAPNKVIWNFTAENTYAMITAPLTLSNRTYTSGTNIIPPTITGFVLKFWQWDMGQPNDRDEHVVLSTNPLFRNHLRREMESSAELYEHRLSRRFVPYLNQKPKRTHSSNMTINQFKERIVIVILNGTKLNTIQTSQNNVTQLCFHVEPNASNFVCQPDLNLQDQSILIADLDQDKSQELISYLTTFTARDHDEVSVTNQWQLQSKVRVIQLETELLKLYENFDQP